MPAHSIGFIGIGNMGLAMALRLRDLGFAVAVRDIDPTREAAAAAHGATVQASPAEPAMDKATNLATKAPKARRTVTIFMQPSFR